ncbi:hypothetical protein EVG20_g2782 [Dentipellis fragilis]|uniref:F-box domain-containing protein n=1 Tax=Dentipellis fragilis TaxID=205917 RepID=A0A4Y9Z668_9AGAM|nr:hypothetical protein EVG20_g2782 [Dentipellis fragilis]
MPSAWNVVSNHTILDAIFAFSSPGTIIRISRTCRRIYAHVKSYLRVAYDINRHLSSFFPDPAAFRSIQARTTTLIAGSNALQLFERTIYPNADLDLYVPKPCVAEVGALSSLLEADYIFVATENQEDDFFAEAPSERSGEHRTQDLSTTYSTCLMNFISFECAYSLFALATLEERCSIVCTNESARIKLAVQKYGPNGHGWKLLRGMHRRAALNGILRTSLRAGHRTVARSWALQLNLDGVSLPRPPAAQDTYRIHDPVTLSQWRFDSQGEPLVRIGPEPCWHARICLFHSALLKYAYVIKDKTETYEAASRFLTLLQRTEGAAQGNLYDAEFITLFQLTGLMATLGMPHSFIGDVLKNAASPMSMMTYG